MSLSDFGEAAPQPNGEFLMSSLLNLHLIVTGSFRMSAVHRAAGRP